LSPNSFSWPKPFSTPLSAHSMYPSSSTSKIVCFPPLLACLSSLLSIECQTWSIRRAQSFNLLAHFAFVDLLKFGKELIVSLATGGTPATPLVLPNLVFQIFGAHGGILVVWILFNSALQCASYAHRAWTFSYIT
jgi:hypothetical protein